MMDRLRPARDEHGSPVLQSEYDYMKQQLEEARQQCVYESGLSASRTIELTEAKKQNVMLRDALLRTREFLETPADKREITPYVEVCEALATTADLAGLILCDAEPVPYLSNGTRYKIEGRPNGSARIIGLPNDLAGEWIALVSATDGKHSTLYQARRSK
jgi:hypothetical protein